MAGKIIKTLYNFFWDKIGAKDWRAYYRELKKENKQHGNIIVKDWPYGHKDEPVFLSDGSIKFESLNCDIFMPKKPVKEKFPIIINIHGGGYASGSKEHIEKQSKLLASKGYCVVSPNYTLSTEKPFPAPIVDMFKLFNFIENHFNSQYYDFDNIFITGSSAGAHIASLCTCLLNNSELMQKYKVCSNLKIKACCFQSGLFSVLRFSGYPILNKFPKVICGDNYNKDFLLEEMSPIDLLTKKFPPLLVVSGNKDFLFKKQKEFIEKCKEVGIDCQHEIITTIDAVHNFNVSNPLSSTGIATNEKIIKFFDKFLNYDRTVENEQKRLEKSDLPGVIGLIEPYRDFSILKNNQPSEFVDNYADYGTNYLFEKDTKNDIQK